jgi:glutaredoxin 3
MNNSSTLDILIFTKNNCPNCVTAKHLLKSKGLPYAEADIEANPELLTELPPSARQMPQVWINGQRVGGLAGLRASLSQLGV